MTTVPDVATFDPEIYRADFPILSTVLHGRVPLAYLDNAATTQRPRQVIDALVNTYEKHYANVHRGIHWLSDQSTDLYEEARENVRDFLGAETREEIIFTRGTTESINLIARSWGDWQVREGDEILLTEMEHHSNIVPWQQLSQRTGCRIRFLPITDEGEIELSALDTLLTERTKMVSLTAVSNVLGTVNPVEEITRRAHAAGALVTVDAAQAVPHQTVPLREWDADFVVFSGHKMLGPSGIGVLYGRAELLDAMPPFMGGGSMIQRVTLEGYEPADLPAKFEAGTPSIVPAIGLGTAINYLRNIGLEAIQAHEQRLTQRAHEVLAEVGGVQLLGPAQEKKAGIVSFVMDGIHAHDVAQILDRHGIAVRAGHHCAMPLHKRLRVSASTRASFYLYNTLEEVERIGEALHDLKHIFRRE